MSKYTKQQKISDETKDDALKMARGTQRPGQTKEQTKLIAQGIQKGIDLYKKQHKSKARELDKKLRQLSTQKSSGQLSDENNDIQPESPKTCKTAWFLLIFSWLGFAGYLLLTKVYNN